MLSVTSVFAPWEHTGGVRAVLVRRAFARGRQVRGHLALEVTLLLAMLAVTATLSTTPPPVQAMPGMARLFSVTLLP